MGSTARISSREVPERRGTGDKTLGCTCFRLRSLSRTVTRLYDAHLARAGLKTTQYSMLCRLYKGPQSMAQLSGRLSMDRTTLTRNLKPLLTAGWVTVVAGRDARQRQVSLTEDGLLALNQGAAEWRRAQSAMSELLGVPALVELHRSVDAALLQLKEVTS